ncbi:beta-glucosidase 12-like [Senna tora]|uniref:Beta-glucosidase 12-like n=1 Tax=Senna tora TaxID=362788 RepID=A0A834WK95_9FABA|nr:beta-glucosidase 12-like [Senna tora]
MALKGNNMVIVIMGVLVLVMNMMAAVEAIVVDVASLNRSSFPAGFVFGTSSSAYISEKISDRSNGDVAVDSYHRYKEDVGIMKSINLYAYRFSISWSRILPSLQPFVTLFHWDLPQTLQDEYGGFFNSRIINDFEEYAEVCFKEFGDRVKYWITLNEPWTYSMNIYTSTNPYLASHYQLLAHAAIVKLYKTKY